MQDIEIWKPIPSLCGFYEASSLGRIRSTNRISTLSGRYLRPIKGKVIKQTLHKKTGYCYLSVCIDGVRDTKLVHRLVAEAWIDNPENKPHVNHLKGIKTDNRPSQLEWSTLSENRLHSFRIGLQTAKGSKNSPATVCDIQNKRSWSHL